MNYTPLSDDMMVDDYNEPQEAPMITALEPKKTSSIAIITGVIVIIALIILFVLFISGKQKNRQNIQNPTPTTTTQFVEKPAKITTVPDYYTMPTIEESLTPVATNTGTIATNPSTTQEKSTIITEPLPELPSAGMPAPLLVAGYLGLFIILVGFVF